VDVGATVRQIQAMIFWIPGGAGERKACERIEEVFHVEHS